MKTSYKSSGVNIKEADIFVDRIKPLVRKTFNKNVIRGIGNFGAFYKIDLKKFKEPVFVSSVDGVGTKLKLAADLKKFDTIGEDLVNHCVNDIAVCGAVPLYFLDYYATGRLKSAEAVKVVDGLVRGCLNNKCSLIGGETAEMPGLYHGNDFDLAGAVTGVVDKRNILDSKNVKSGDVLIGLPSSGLHTNGYSLVRKIFDTRKEMNRAVPGTGFKLGNELLRVHRSYLNIIQSSLAKFKINSISHITGGGIIGNTKRVVTGEMEIIINWEAWKRPEIFHLIQNEGNVSEKDMRNTFNLGIGLIFIINKNKAFEFAEFLKLKKETPHIIGYIN